MREQAGREAGPSTAHRQVGPEIIDASEDHLDHLHWEELKMRSIALVLALHSMAPTSTKVPSLTMRLGR